MSPESGMAVSRLKFTAVWYAHSDSQVTLTTAHNIAVSRFERLPQARCGTALIVDRFFHVYRFEFVKSALLSPVRAKGAPHDGS